MSTMAAPSRSSSSARPVCGPPLRPTRSVSRAGCRALGISRRGFGSTRRRPSRERSSTRASPRGSTHGRRRGHPRGEALQPPHACLPFCPSRICGRCRGHPRGEALQSPHACLPFCLSRICGWCRGHPRGEAPQLPNAPTRKSDARWPSPAHRAEPAATAIASGTRRGQAAQLRLPGYSPHRRPARQR